MKILILLLIPFMLTAQSVKYNSETNTVKINSLESVYNVEIESSNNKSFNQSYSSNVINKEIEGIKDFEVSLNDMETEKYIRITLFFRLQKITFVVNTVNDINNLN